MRRMRIVQGCVDEVQSSQGAGAAVKGDKRVDEKGVTGCGSGFQQRGKLFINLRPIINRDARALGVGL
jgi:hypothetical protein